MTEGRSLFQVCVSQYKIFFRNSKMTRRWWRVAVDRYWIITFSRGDFVILSFHPSSILVMVDTCIKRWQSVSLVLLINQVTKNVPHDRFSFSFDFFESQHIWARKERRRKKYQRAYQFAIMLHFLYSYAATITTRIASRTFAESCSWEQFWNMASELKDEISEDAHVIILCSSVCLQKWLWLRAIS